MMNNTVFAGERAGGSPGLMEEFYNLLNRDPNFRSFFHNHILDGLWYCDLAQPEAQWTSPRFWQLLGYAPDQLPPKDKRHWEAHIHPDDLQRCQDEFYQFCASSQNVLHQTLRFSHGYGRTLWLNCRALLIRNSRGTPIRVAGMYYDVTAFKNHEQVLLKANRDFHHKQQNIAHELKQPLASAIMLLDTLQNTEAEFPESNADLIKDALDSLNGMNQLLAGILQQREGDFDLTMQDIRVDRLIERITRDLRAKVNLYDADIRLHNTPVIQGNPILLRILFQNLIANAIKYRREDSHAIIDIRAKDCQQHWEFAIADNGIGIDQQYHQIIFQRYARSSDNVDREGEGLGLALCQEAVASHRGRIWVKSDPGEGSTFYFTLPKQQAQSPDSREAGKVWQH